MGVWEVNILQYDLVGVTRVGGISAEMLTIQWVNDSLIFEASSDRRLKKKRPNEQCRVSYQYRRTQGVSKGLDKVGF